MENRVLLAFVLSLVVFVGWGYFLAAINPPPPEAEKKKAQSRQAQKQAPPTGELPAQPVPGDTAPPAVPGAPAAVPAPAPFPGEEKLITVFNGRARFLFSNKGGTLKQVLLPEYHNDNGEVVNLVNAVPGAPAPLALEADDEAITYILQNAFYEPSTEFLEIDEAKPEGKLKLTLRHESGLEVVREFTFRHKQFLVQVNTRISALPLASRNLNYRVLWGPSMGGAVSSQTDYFIFSGPTTFVNNERIETPEDEIGGGVTHKGDLKWTSFQNKYFAAALIPDQGAKAARVEKKNDELYVGLDFESVQSAASVSYLLYAGTKQLQVLEDSGHKLFRLLDYGWLGNKFAFLVKPLLKTLEYFYGITKNYGWSIIILTVIIKILFFPLTHKSFKSMKGMQKVQPYVKVIQERNKNDRQKMNEEMLELYKKHKVNPLGGCLPMLLQIPVFIALYHALFFSIELRGAPFMLWIQDLSVQDPYYVTPVLMGATMFLQQRLSPAIGDPVQQKIMMFLPIVFTFLFITFPAGLVIYWTVNNILTIAQQYYIYKIAK